MDRLRGGLQSSMLIFSDCLQIFLTALEASFEGTAFVHARIATAQLPVAFFVGAIAILVQHGGLEAAAEVAFVIFEVAAVRLIFFFFGIAYANPPHFTSSVDAFGAGVFQCAANRVSLVVLGHHHYNRAALSQSIFVNVQLVFRQSLEDFAF